MFGGLDLDDLPPGLLCQLGESVEQNGLANPSKTGDDQGLLSASLLEALEKHGEVLRLPVAPDERLGCGAGVRGLRVVDVVHGAALEDLLCFTQFE